MALISFDSKPKILSESSKLERKDGNFGINEDESGIPLVVVRVMVAENLLQRGPFNPIDSSTCFEKESDE
ncbi:unnamed protein product [Dovyalis caffra]|uniref:Uncharacterized protein n=1 Tax=Dovyalis caffra TaxID=77055 RepID=A0AAV1SUG0_9ROSI|nr:unnamed protein product [Dovyalis caffra]